MAEAADRPASDPREDRPATGPIRPPDGHFAEYWFDPAAWGGTQPPGPIDVVIVHNSPEARPVPPEIQPDDPDVATGNPEDSL